MNEKRIRMMIKLADFEKRNHKELRNAETYYRSDYIGIHLLKNLIQITIAFLIGAGLWACYYAEPLMKKLNKMDIRGTGVKLLIAYIVTVTLFLALNYVIHTVRFYLAERKLQTWRNMLDRLVLEYDAETPHRMERRGRERHRRREEDDDDSTVKL